MSKVAPEIILLSVALLGLLIGSFLNSCIYRIPLNIPLTKPARSVCPHCVEQITWWQNIPLLSFILLRGKAACCGNAISWQYPIIELLTSALFVMIYSWFGVSVQTATYIGVIPILLIIALIDWRYYRIPNLLTYPGGIVLLALAMSFDSTSIISVLQSGLFGGGLLLIIRLLGNTMLRQESMGWGDIKLGILIGMLLGEIAFLVVLFLASLSGIVYALVANSLHMRNADAALPFGTFLSGCTIVMIFFQESMLDLFTTS